MMALSKLFGTESLKLDTLCRFTSDHKYEILAGSLALGCTVWAFNYWWQRRNLPPGPKGKWFVGNSEILMGDMAKSLVELREKYGDIVHLDIGGGNHWILLNSYDLVKEVFVDRSTEIGDRPSTHLSELANFCDEIVTMPYCEQQQKSRKFYTQCLKSAGLSQNKLDKRLQNEWDSLHKELANEKGSFEPTLHFKRAFTNVFLGMIFDKQYPHDDKRIDDYCQMLDDFYGTFMIDYLNPFFPYWLARLIIPGYSDAEKAVTRETERVTKFCTDIIEEHVRTFDENELRDFVDICLKHGVLEQKGMRHLAHVCSSFFIDAVGTVGHMMNWTIVYLCNYPEYQKRIREEMEGIGKNLVLEDRKRMPFTDAFVSECFRMVTPAYLNVGNNPFSKTTLAGYTIPTNYKVTACLYALHHDERYFKDPETFNPERFIEDGKIKRYNEFMPFSMGRRKCMGELLVQAEIFYFTAMLVSQYEVCGAGDKAPEPESMPGFIRMVKPFEMVLKEPVSAK